MEDKRILPPGKSPLDPSVSEIDAVAFSLNKVRTFLHWIDEHRASFETARASDPDTAERELENLAHATNEALTHIGRLTELLLAGYSINSAKRLPRDLARLTQGDLQPPLTG